MLYYAPQGWVSDDSDAIERLKIQYGTSYCYPISSIGAHVSAVPNHQVNRITPLATRANVACFGTFGYELDLNRLTAEEREEVRAQVAFMKEYREIIQFGDFYRLRSPFEGNFTAWMAVSPDRRTALVGWYRLLSEINGPCRRLMLRGLDPDLCCTVDGSDVPLWRRADAGGPAGHGQRRRITPSRNEENFSQRSCVEPWISSPELPAHM